MPSWVSIFSDIIGILGGVFAFLAWIQSSRLKKDADHEKQRQNARIKVILTHGNQKYELPVDLRRSELNRSELLGRLGMIPIKKDSNNYVQKRFAISYLNSIDFFERLEKIILGSGNDVLIIPCMQKEFEQFDITF